VLSVRYTRRCRSSLLLHCTNTGPVAVFGPVWAVLLSRSVGLHAFNQHSEWNTWAYGRSLHSYSPGHIMWDLWWTKWYWGRFSPSTSVSPSLDIAVGIATGYGLDDRGVGVRVSVGLRIFTSPCHPDRLCPTQLLSNGHRGALSLGREADHSLPTNAEVKNTWVSTSTPHTSSWRSA
jgi:hypothetical protein